jgi:DNA-binding response OmpR family regulator
VPDDGAPGRRVAIVADDLIWSTRLTALVRVVGAEPIACTDAAALAAALPRVDRVLVDLTARAHDPLAAVRVAAEAGLPVLCVGQHDDDETRRAALGAGASRVLAYRKLATDGPETIRRWLAEGEPTRRRDPRS